MPLLPALAVLAGALVYINALGNPFVYDDRTSVVENPSIRHLANLPAVVLGSLFRPLTNLTYAVDFSLWGLNPFGFHLTSVLLHLVNVALLFLFARRAIADWKEKGGGARAAVKAGLGGFVAAALLAVHPLMSEAVGYTAARAEVLCCTFMLAGGVLLRRALARLSWPAVAGGVAAFVLALASKEVAASLPFIVLLYDRLLLGADAVGRRHRLVRLHIPMIALVALAAAVRIAIFATVERGLAAGFWGNLEIELVVLWRYLLLLLAPISQSIVHSVPPATGPLDVGALVALAALVLLVAALARVRHRDPLLVLGMAWFLLALAPSHVIPLAEPMAEHRVYVASCGVFLAAGAALARCLSWLAGQRPRLVAWVKAAVALALVALAVATVARNRVWADPVRLWQDAASKAADTWTPQYALGDALAAAGRCGDALEPYRRAIAILPDMLDAYLNLAVCLGKLGRADEATTVLEEALRHHPGNSKALHNLGVMELLGGRAEAARQRLEEAVRADPSNVKARELLVGLYEESFNDPQRALALCLEIQALAPQTPGVPECIQRNRSRLAR